MCHENRITETTLQILREQFAPLIGTQIKSLTLPKDAVIAFEPSQIGSIVGALMDALIPHLPAIPNVGLTKHEGVLKDREGYPDYRHTSGCRVELKLLYIDNPDLIAKKPSTPREPSARLTQKVTVKNVCCETDALLVLAYQLKPHPDNADLVSPTITDLEVLSVIELVEARDERMKACGGMWFGNYETPTILTINGRAKRKAGTPLDTTSYGRKQSEGKDFNEDTNFGKLKRIPHARLQAFLHKHGLASTDAPASDDEQACLELEELDGSQ